MKDAPYIFDDPDFAHARPQPLAWKFEPAEPEESKPGCAGVLMLWGFVGTVLLAALAVHGLVNYVLRSR